MAGEIRAMAAPRFSILMPTYNGAEVIRDTLASIVAQDFSDFELIITDDCSDDATVEAAGALGDARIRIYKNPVNLGYPANIRSCSAYAQGEILYLMGQDDIMAAGALRKTHEAFALHPAVGAVTRPYYWFDADVMVPVRAKKCLNARQDEMVTITDDPARVIAVLHTLDQLSGLAMRRAYIEIDFHDDVFPCHVYPFVSVFKKHPVVFLKDYAIAVRIRSSQCRSVSSIYRTSPLKSWVDMFSFVFAGAEHARIRQYCIKDFAARNYVGLVQIRNYGRYSWLVREIALLLYYRPMNACNPVFWFFALGTMLMPPCFLIPLVDWYKNTVNAQRLSGIAFSYQRYQ